MQAGRLAGWLPACLPAESLFTKGRHTISPVPPSNGGSRDTHTHTHTNARTDRQKERERDRQTKAVDGHDPAVPKLPGDREDACAVEDVRALACPPRPAVREHARDAVEDHADVVALLHAAGRQAGRQATTWALVETTDRRTHARTHARTRRGEREACGCACVRVPPPCARRHSAVLYLRYRYVP